MDIAEQLGVLSKGRVWDLKRWEKGHKERKNQGKEVRLAQGGENPEPESKHKGTQETERAPRQGSGEGSSWEERPQEVGGKQRALGQPWEDRDTGLKGPPSPQLRLTSVQPQCSAAVKRKAKPLLPQLGEFDIQSMKINSPKVRGLSHP